MDQIRYTPIGIIHSPNKEPKGTPIQPRAAQDVRGTVEVFPEFVEGLRDIDGFSHVLLVYHFHLAGEWSSEIKPFLDDQTHGLFATRAPNRPNPIGISVVRLVEVQGSRLEVCDLDIVDGTPLLDIKPYVPEFDVRDVQKSGWLEKNVGKLPTSRDDGRFTK